jgi:DNA (cytosine-5)-methyltransferase 1
MTTAIDQKLERLASGGKPRVLDLFSGCGGFSLGFERAGCKIVGGVELDPTAARSHARNFHGGTEGPHCKARDITEQDPLELLAEFGCNRPIDAVDIIIGGPPCPAFTRVGRAKLREIHKHPEAYQHDPRAKLYLPYLKYVKALQPVALVMENVPGVLNYGGHNLAEEISEVLEGSVGGFRCQYTILNAAAYEVPQLRERFFLVAIHSKVSDRFAFPPPVRRVELPQGYRQSRDEALKVVMLPGMGKRYVETGAAIIDRPGPVEVKEALRDLPPLKDHLEHPGDRTARHLDKRLGRRYGRRHPSGWVKEHMLGWPSRELVRSKDQLLAHVIRGLGHRDHRLFRDLKAGSQYPEAYKLALNKFGSFLVDLEDQGIEIGPALTGGGALDAAAHEYWLASQKDQPDPGELRGGWLGLKPLVVARGQEIARILAVAEQVAAGFLLPPPVLTNWGGHKHVDALDQLLAPQGADLVSWGERLPKLRRCLVSTLRRNRFFRDGEFWAEQPRPDTPADLLSHLTERRLKELLAHLEATIDKLGDRPQLQLWQENEDARPLGAAVGAELLALSATLSLHDQLKALFVPPYDPSKFPNRWRKMEPDQPARTLMAHLGKDSYSHIHYDSAQARTISVREAARLQSFPDSFRLCGRMNAGFRQIGNAVPPMLAWHLAQALLRVLPRPGQDGGVELLS